MIEMIYICIPAYNRLELTIACVKSIQQQSYSDYEIVICEHSPGYETYNKLKKEFPDIVLLKGDESMWWTAATNLCITYVLKNCSDADYVLTINNDTELDSDCIRKLIRTSEKYSSSIVGSVNLLIDKKNKIEPSALHKRKVFGVELYSSVNQWEDSINEFSGCISVDALSGKGVLMPVTVYKTLGLYNDELLPHYHADTEFTIRAKRGGYNLYLNYDAKTFSHHTETGISARNSSMSISAFIESFSSIKSTRHLTTLKNRTRLLYGSKYPFYLAINLIGIIGGFFRRYLRSKYLNLMKSKH